MGIQGLLPFLDKSSKRTNIKEFAGCTVAIDAYCWLHKGAFACSDKLILKEPTDIYINYCMKYVNMLLSHRIKPILVFDGQHLPAKASTEMKRRESRNQSKKKGAELLRAGRTEEARQHLRRAVDITHEMALNVIKECRRRNVDCIVAPYEADAQLAFLNINNIAHVIITEDSDLMLFGSIRVMFKMDINGNGILIEQERLYLSMGVRSDLFDNNKFRYMCILSGCDYLSSLPGIGLGKACKFINRSSDTDIYNALRKLPANLNMWSLVVTDEYRDKFMQADNAFLYQLVYDPLTRKQVPLHKPEDDKQIVGTLLDESIAFQLALGNLDPFTLQTMDDYDPEQSGKVNVKTQSWKQTHISQHKSIWTREFTPTAMTLKNKKPVVRQSTAGVAITTDYSDYFKIKKRQEDKETQGDNDDLLKMYGNVTKRPRTQSDVKTSLIVPASPSPKKSPTTKSQVPESPVSDVSPVLSNRKTRNPFAVSNCRSNKRPRLTVGALDMFESSGQLEESSYFTKKEPTEVHISTSQVENDPSIVNNVKRSLDWEDSDSGVSCTTQTNSSVSPPTPRPSLKTTPKKSTPACCKKSGQQQTLLSMFGFKSKPKMQSTKNS